MDIDNRKEQLVKGLAFKDLVGNKGTLDFVDDSSMSFADINSVPTSKFSNFILLLSKKINILSQGKGIFAFLIEVFIYTWHRVRVLIVLISVLGELIGSFLGSIKKYFVRSMFWGRGKLFRFVIQTIGLILITIVLVSSGYRTNSLQIAPVIASSNEYQYEMDLISQKGSTTTQVPKARGRLDVVEHTVKKGDTVSSIAAYYGVSEDTVLWANSLASSSILSIGQMLKIPQGTGVLVTVKSGDSIEKLADKYSSNPQSIIDANLWLDYPFEIHDGDELFIPDGTPPAPPPVAIGYTGVVTPKYSPPSTGTPVSNVGRFLGWPVEGGKGKLTQCFSGWHNGVDIADSSNPNIVAAAGGTVTFAGCQSGYCPSMGSNTGGSGLAWTVMIDHGNGYTSVYGHLKNIYVSSGQAVSQGQSIAQMGATGLAYGTHIHFMVLAGGSWSGITNPASLMTTSICGY